MKTKLKYGSDVKYITHMGQNESLEKKLNSISKSTVSHEVVSLIPLSPITAMLIIALILG